MFANNRPTHLFLHDVNHANDVSRKLFYVKAYGQSHAKEDPKMSTRLKGTHPKGTQFKGGPKRGIHPKRTQSRGQQIQRRASQKRV